MNIELKGKKALVTGSSGGIGLAIAMGLAEAGAQVVLHGRSADKLARAAEAITQKFPAASVSTVQADLATADGAASISAAHPDVDILVNNAGFFAPKSFTEITDDDWQDMLDINVMSGIRLSRYYLPRMLAANWGRIVFISSESGVQIPAEMIHYGVSKTAMLAVSRGLAELTAGTGVTVNAVLPGPTRSEGVADFFAEMAKEQGVSQDEMERNFIAQHRPTSLLRRLATVDEVANMVVYTCSTQASATNGAALRVDGGVVRSIL
ncbi:MULTISPECIES: SDR family NAD(P)-dependent oxidoreductase [Achromobacter]|uniref:SDR family NAD(P)-dependent oxidoreductase n=1 Tax=Achromobacter spanius TaxID=217203 RepID=A0ABY8GZV9_9BURK|nr:MULTISPECIES: SDR family NAD(P)-dependent oxidoreductase [Achromobacter]WAI85887.1 SDR family NAD(P)-dependent oxidoreductase [Achromobacter spanius]WEX95968.1 SDR family NAD(P)-dependent oxidoreductase [Achromobacter sp. SS2-2022]WFP10312.1 SDR family NAD(P)-dependent oxidoreductase [Achromobacter spanius]